MRDGLLTEKSTRELAAWYRGGSDAETFEAHLMMLRAYNSLVTSAQRGRRTNLSLERYGLLRLLYLAPQRRMLLSDISRALGVSPASITKLVNALVGAGLVRRVGFAGVVSFQFSVISSEWDQESGRAPGACGLLNADIPELKLSTEN